MIVYPEVLWRWCGICVGEGLLALVVVEVGGEALDFRSLQENKGLGLVLQVDLLPRDPLYGRTG